MTSYQEEIIPVQQRFKVEKERIEDSFEPDKDLSHVSPITHGIKAEKHTDVYKNGYLSIYIGKPLCKSKNSKLYKYIFSKSEILSELL